MASQSPDQLSIAGKAKLQNTPVVVVRTSPKFGSFKNYEEYWVDPDAEFRIVKWIRHQEGQITETATISYADKSNESQPKSITQSRFLEGGKADETYTVTVKDWAVNPPVQKSDFVLTPTSELLLLDGKLIKN